MTGWLNARTKKQGPLAFLSFLCVLPSDLVAKVSRDDTLDPALAPGASSGSLLVYLLRIAQRLGNEG
jgi:hypothetical protein